MSKKLHSLKIPGDAEWIGYKGDLDVQHSYRMLFGKSLDDVQRFFGGAQSISRADELLFMPRAAFQYYVCAFAQFVMSDCALEDADSASSFLRLLLAREKREPGSVSQIYSRLAPAMEFVAAHQEQFDADINIYGKFNEIVNELKILFGQ